MIRRFGPLLALLVLALTFCQSEAQTNPTWKNDALGRPAPPCMVLDTTTGVSTPCSAAAPLPTSATGAGAGLGTTSGTSVTGFGKAWYPSTYIGGAVANPHVAIYQDGLTINTFHRTVACGNCLTIGTSTDGGVTFVDVNTSFIVGNVPNFVIKVPSSPPRYLGYAANGAGSLTFNSTSLLSGWAAGTTASPDLNNGITGFASNTTGSTVLSIGGVGGGNHTNVCRSTDQGRTFPSCVNVQAAQPAGGLWFGGGTTWFASSQNVGISKSTDDGLTWSLLVDIGNTYGQGYCLPSSSYQTCVTIVDGQVFRSTNGGTSWTSILTAGVSGICDYGSGNLGLVSATPPQGFGAIANNAFSSQDSGLSFYAGSVYGSRWDGTGAQGLSSFTCNSTGRGYYSISTTGTFPAMAFYNPLTQPGGTLQSSAGGYSVAALIQSGVLLNAAPTTSAANTAATITLTGTAGSRICIREVAVLSSAAGTPTLVLQDNAVTLVNYGTLATGTAATRINGSPLFCGQTGNSVQVVVGAAGVGVTTTTSVVADRYPN